MDDRVEDFAQRANAARLSASKAEDEGVRTQWLMIAEMWGMLALESQHISRMREKPR